MDSLGRGLSDPVPEAEWEVWYQDMFDRECPRMVKAAGFGLAKGLAELWARHLFETVQANGQKGFSRFNLWWKQKQQSVEIVGEWAGAVCLRQWVYGNRRQACPRYLEAGDKNLLRKVAVTHARLILAGQTSEVILSAAVATASHKDFEKRLSSLAKDRAGGDHGS